MFLSKIIRDSGGNKCRTTGTKQVQDDIYTCHCEKIEDFRGNPENTCMVLDYFVTAFLVMTVIFYTLQYPSP